MSGRRLDPERFETVLVHGSLAAGEESMADLAEVEGARTQFLPSLRRAASPLNDGRALWSLVRLMRRFRPHIVHTHTAKAGFLGRQAALLVRPRPVLVHTFHGHVLEGYFGPLTGGVYRSFERAQARVTDCLIGVSPATVDDLVRLGVAPRERFRVVPLGLELSRYRERTTEGLAQLRAEFGVEGDEAVIVYVGRLAPIKRVEVLIRAVAEALRQGASVRLAIVGDGETRAGLERLSHELDIAAGVRFLGYRRDLPRVYSVADIAALSSDSEGTPVSLIEAAAAGLPAVATAVGGVPDVVTAESGMLVPAGDHRAMGGALARLAGDPALRARMGAAGRERVLERYTAERLVADIEGLYTELLSTRAAIGD